MFIVTGTQQDDTAATKAFGPFDTLDNALKETVTGVRRGWNGKETRFTFFRLDNNKFVNVGYYLFLDDSHIDEEDEDISMTSYLDWSLINN